MNALDLSADPRFRDKEGNDARPEPPVMMSHCRGRLPRLAAVCVLSLFAIVVSFAVSVAAQKPPP